MGKRNEEKKSPIVLSAVARSVADKNLSSLSSTECDLSLDLN